MVADDAGDHVGRAAGRERHDDGNRPGWIVLRGRWNDADGAREEAGHEARRKTKRRHWTPQVSTLVSSAWALIKKAPGHVLERPGAEQFVAGCRRYSVNTSSRLARSDGSTARTSRNKAIASKV